MRSHITALLFEGDSGEAEFLQKLLLLNDGIVVKLEKVTRFQDGLNFLRRGGIDVILLDVSQPVGHDLEAFNELYNQSFGIPIIVLTGDDDDSLAMKAVQSGAQDFLVKGEVDRNVLLRSIRYAIERNRLLKQLEESRRLERHLAYHDFLTGLPNRLLFHDRLHQAVTQAKRHGQRVSLLFLDLDGFKRINDTLGHGIGDLLLKAVAQRLAESVRESDTVARLGGDEFTIILFGVNDIHDSAKVARKILSVMAQPYIIDEHELFITASIGISMYPDDGKDAETLIKKADIAMYRAKGSGKNNYKQYILSMDASFFEHLTLENSLRKAIENKELVVHYQPQVNLNSGEIVGVEALVRWQHPTFGLVPPSKFIPLAEETGIIVSIDEWVLRTACEQTKIWNDSINLNLYVAVNLSARQFRQKKLPDTISKILDGTKLDPENVCLEITESNVMQNIESTIETFEILKNFGLQLSVDDFGTGYSSLNYLKRFPIDMLKVDRAFVSGIPVDRDDMAISTAIVVLAKSMALKVVAEGVETADQVAFLKSLNCDTMQGFYFSRPVTADLLTELLRSGKRLRLKDSIQVMISKDNEQYI